MPSSWTPASSYSPSCCFEVTLKIRKKNGWISETFVEPNSCYDLSNAVLVIDEEQSSPKMKSRPYFYLKGTVLNHLLKNTLLSSWII